MNIESQLRPGKTASPNDLKNLNPTGKRIKWCREMVGLSQQEVCDRTSIPKSSYSGRENGVRATFSEELLVLSRLFNKEWKEKFKAKHYPEYNGSTIARISLCWLLFGIEEE